MKSDIPMDPSFLSGKVEHALGRIEDIDRYKNLHGAIPILLFLVSGALAARSYFWLIDLTTWLGLGRVDPIFPASMSFILLFVVWMLAFLAAMSLLQWMNFRDIRTSAKSRLSHLDLTAEEARVLESMVKSRSWKHERELRDATAGLEKRTP